jgi:hypothetical protein
LKYSMFVVYFTDINNAAMLRLFYAYCLRKMWIWAFLWNRNPIIFFYLFFFLKAVMIFFTFLIEQMGWRVLVLARCLCIYLKYSMFVVYFTDINNAAMLRLFYAYCLRKMWIWAFLWNRNPAIRWICPSIYINNDWTRACIIVTFIKSLVRSENTNG